MFRMNNNEDLDYGTDANKNVLTDFELEDNCS